MPVSGDYERSGRLRQDLRFSVVDGVAFGGMVGLGETYLPAFALAVGLSEMMAGMVSSVPLVAGGLMQMASPLAVKLLRSHRRWVVCCAVAQALTFIPLVVAAAFGAIGPLAILTVAAVYWGTGLATGPAWNTWIGTLVPRSIRPRFFARRTRLSQAGVFVGVLLGGLLLQHASHRIGEMTVFVGMFVTAGLCRLISAFALRLHSEPVPLPANMRKIPWKRVRHHLQASSGGRLLVYLVAVQAAVQLSGPFFTPFMLRQLNFSYGQLVALFSIAFLSKVLSLPVWGHVARRIGARQLMWIGGIGIVPLSGCWLISQHMGWLLLLQAVGGIVWAAYELAFFLLFFESIPEEERTSVLTLYNLLNTLAWVSGSLLGGVILTGLGSSFHGYLTVFGVSSLLRLSSLFLLKRVPRLVVDSDAMAVRTMAVRPGAASLDTPVLSSLPDQVHDPDREV